MECFKRYGMKFIPKHQYRTLLEAIEDAAIINKKFQQIHKVVPYKCTLCNQFHLGKNKTLIDHKK